MHSTTKESAIPPHKGTCDSFCNSWIKISHNVLTTSYSENEGGNWPVVRSQNGISESLRTVKVFIKQEVNSILIHAARASKFVFTF